MATLFWIAPALPLVLVLVGLMPGPRLSENTRSLLAFGIAFWGSGAVVLGALVSGPDDKLLLLRGFAVVFAIVAALFWFGRAAPLPRVRRWDIVVIGLPVAIALWSLACVPAILIGARLLAQGEPWCLAHHAPPGPVRSLAELRGTSFTTDRTGYNAAATDYFHGLLLVDGPTGRRAYNWSPLRMRFQVLPDPAAFRQPVLGACEPGAD